MKLDNMLYKVGNSTVNFIIDIIDNILLLIEFIEGDNFYVVFDQCEGVC